MNTVFRCWRIRVLCLLIYAAIWAFTIAAEGASSLSNSIDNVVVEVGKTMLTAERLMSDGALENVLVCGEMGMNIASDRATWEEAGAAHLILQSPSFLPRDTNGFAVNTSENIEIAIATNTAFLLTVGRLKESRFRDVLVSGMFNGVMKGKPKLSNVVVCGHLVEDNRMWTGRLPVFLLSGINLREFLNVSSSFGYMGVPAGVIEARRVPIHE